MMYPWNGGLFLVTGSATFKLNLNTRPELLVEVGKTKRGPWTVLFRAYGLVSQDEQPYKFSAVGFNQPGELVYVRSRLTNPRAGKVKFEITEIKR